VGPTGPPGPAGATGATGPAGVNGANGTNGEKGATGAAGTEKNGVACEKGTPVATCTLASGYQETGTWSVNISAATGDPQVQASAAISFPVRLKKGDTVKGVYRTVTEVEKPAAPCAGSPLEPFAEKGHLCVYRGFAFKGGLESQDRNAAFFELADSNGENEALTGKVEPLGSLVVFRSVNNSPIFAEEVGEGPSKITELSYLSAAGAWAATEN
jgi:hypothetical protein